MPNRDVNPDDEAPVLIAGGGLVGDGRAVGRRLFGWSSEGRQQCPPPAVDLGAAVRQHQLLIERVAQLAGRVGRANGQIGA